MPTMIIPTRNRPTALLGVLQYLEKFYPGTKVVIADGSSASYQSENCTNFQTLGQIEIDYRPYPEDLALFERLIDVVNSQTDEYLMMGADDDFPMMEVLEQGEEYLRNHPECVTVMGALVSLSLNSEDSMSVRLNPARNIVGPSVKQRVNMLAAWPVSTSYAVTRREHLIRRYQRHKDLYLAGFFDYTVAIQDATHGAIKAIPSIGYISTRNYNHAYWRAEDKLVFLRRSDMLLKIVDAIVQDFVQYGDMTPDEARQVAERLACRRISEHVGGPSHKRKGFANSSSFQNPVIQQQWRMFNDLFREETEVRNRYHEKLSFISSCVMNNARSQDNAGEPSKSETMVASSHTAPAW